jgi:hypothetical protein
MAEGHNGRARMSPQLTMLFHLRAPLRAPGPHLQHQFRRRRNAQVIGLEQAHGERRDARDDRIVRDKEEVACSVPREGMAACVCLSSICATVDTSSSLSSSHEYRIGRGSARTDYEECADGPLH